MDRRVVATILNDIALMMELLGDNPFKVNAYHTAARTIELLNEDLEILVAEDKLRSIKGIGSSIAKQISEIFQTGTTELYQTLKAEIPASVYKMLGISGLGPKKINILFRKLGVTNIEQLEEACRNNRLIGLSGFGLKTQENILKGIDRLKMYAGQHLYYDALLIAQELVRELSLHPEVIQVQWAGSLRRRKETVKDIDLLVTSHEPQKVADYFTRLPQVEAVLGSGPTKVSVLLSQGINADLRIIEKQEFPYALHHFTGSQEHNTALRHRAKKLGLKMNEYGLFDEQGKNVTCQSEEDIFRILGLKYIPPELRENMGEIEAAEQGELPHLLEMTDIKGVFHIHTIYSDGTSTIKEMVRAVQNQGWNYLGISDHSQSAFYANGLKTEQIRQQIKEIDALNELNKDFTIFKGIETDILKDGSLDYPDEVLSQFDFVIASIHSGFNMTESEATGRLIAAIKNPYVTMLGHPTGRILLGREGYPVNMKSIIDAARDYRVVIELNANPYRLDLDWRWCRYAKEQGVIVSLNPDAHHIGELSYLDVGLGIARKGWLEARDLFNTMTREQVKEYLVKKKQ